jgi:hypothetical protein
MIDQMGKHRSRLRRVGVVSDPKYRLITPEQLKAGYMRLTGVTPSHHNWLIVSRTENGNYVVLEPDEPT